MFAEDFLDLTNYLSKGKDTGYPRVADMREIQFRKNTTKMCWKTSFEDTAYKSGEFLQKMFREVLLPLKGPARGLNLEKKEDIITKLLALMPANRRRFRLDLPDNAMSEELSTNLEHFFSFFFFILFFISGTEHPKEDNPDLYYWAEITGQHTQTSNK